MQIDLRSDTLTRPGPEMLACMLAAEVGDDVFGEDPTVNALEEKTAKMLGYEAAIFCPSGTMTNQIAIRLHTRPGDEVICHRLAHIYNYEGGGIAMNSGASVRLIEGNLGRLTADSVKMNINPVDDYHCPLSRLVSVENTMNKGGGSIYDRRELIEINQVCTENDLKFHLDGARLFNALVETGENPADTASLFDTTSICLSKGLGAPVGSLLAGSKADMDKARRIRKAFGGGMRQAGYLAAAGIYALDHNILRLKDDHTRAKSIACVLEKLPIITEILPVTTNILVFQLDNKIPAARFISDLEQLGVLVVSFGHQRIRMVTHLDFNDDMLEQLIRILKNLRY
jgi:threonine aldolase